MDTLAFKRAFLREAVEREYLVFFEHDPVVRSRVHPRERRADYGGARDRAGQDSGPEAYAADGIVTARGGQQLRRQPEPERTQIGESMNVEIGIIGGSGLYDMAELTDREEVTLDDAVRRAVGARTCSARCAGAGWRFSRGTAPGIG